MSTQSQQRQRVSVFFMWFLAGMLERAKGTLPQATRKTQPTHLFKNVEHFVPTSSYSSQYTEYKDEHPKRIKQGKGMESQEATG